MADLRQRDALRRAATTGPRYRVEFLTAGRTIGLQCAAEVFPHHSTLDPFASALLRDGIREGELRLVDTADDSVVARRRLESPPYRHPATGANGARSQRRRFAVEGNHPPTNRQETQALAIGDRARSQLADLHRRANLPPGATIALLPGDGAQARFVVKRPDATDLVVAHHADGSPLLVVPAQAAGALAGATLDFVLTPEPGFVVRP